MLSFPIFVLFMYWLVAILMREPVTEMCPTPAAVRLGSLSSVHQRISTFPPSVKVQARVHCLTDSTRSGSIVTLPLWSCPKSDWESVEAVTSIINTHCTEGVDEWLKSDWQLVTGYGGLPIVVTEENILRSVSVSDVDQHAIVTDLFTRGFQRTVPSATEDLWVVLLLPDLAARRTIVFVRLFYFLVHPVGETIFDSTEASAYVVSSAVLGEPHETTNSVARAIEIDDNRRMVHIRPKVWDHHHTNSSER